MNIKAAIKSMRLRTLLLSTGGVLLGILLAFADFRVSPLVALLIVLTTVCLQILSNLSNELGDVLHGTDTPERLGPQYGLNGGEMTVPQMKRLIGLFVALCCIFGLAMTWVSFGTIFELTPLLILLLGAGAIMAAMKYTLGRNPYGYRGLGDLYVFIFFGLVAVLGSYFVCAHEIPSWKLILPASAVGFFSMGVLNVNNIRDLQSDAENRVTVAIKLGERKAKRMSAWSTLADAGLIRELRRGRISVRFPSLSRSSRISIMTSSPTRGFTSSLRKIPLARHS